MNKRIFCIRHGQGFHNTDFFKLGREAYYDPKKADPQLTNVGIDQAKSLNKDWEEVKNIDVVIVSPLKRCLQTATNIFEGHDVTMIACEDAREFPMGKQYSNKRSQKWLLQKEFPHVNFIDLQTSEDKLWDPDNYETLSNLERRVNNVKKTLDLRTEKNIALVAHSTFLMKMLFDTVDEDESKELIHCHPYIFTPNNDC
tara:strand:+ start:211 stop:807 length:597 start_codon:yes stop_codon:yes gene_type:complete